jgi:8-oxo-dGTP pyrophosphatase MutT (NUDIX family)
MPNNPFRLISTELKYKNPWISVREDLVVRPGGTEGIFGIVDMKDGVTVIAIDTEKNVYLTQEYAYAVWYESLEAISGGIDGDEDMLESAKRELAEEIGVTSDKWTYLGFVDPFTSVIKSRNHIFLAENLHYWKAHPDDGEVIKTIKIPFTNALELVYSGQISHAASVVWLLRSKDIILN